MESRINSCNEWDTKLFLLALLMSSMLMYNSKSAMDSETIKKLAIVTSIGDKIKSKRCNKYSQLNSIFKASCDFVWIVRDFALAQTESANSKLLKFLALEKLDSKTNEKRREAITFHNKMGKGHE